MKTVRVIIFVIGLFLINYVGGIPQDSRNLFITHSIFFAPLLVDFFPLLNIQSFIKWIVRIIWIAGILVLLANILGVAGIIIIQAENYTVTFAPEYLTIVSFDLGLRSYLLWSEIVYGAIFTGILTLQHQLDKVSEVSSENSREGLRKHVHS